MSVFEKPTYTASLFAIQAKANDEGSALLEEVVKGEVELHGGTTTGLPLRFRINTLETAGLVDKETLAEKGKKPQISLRLTNIGTAALEGFRRYGAIMIPARARLAREEVLSQADNDPILTQALDNFVSWKVAQTVQPAQIPVEQLLEPELARLVRVQHNPDNASMLECLVQQAGNVRYDEVERWAKNVRGYGKDLSKLEFMQVLADLAEVRMIKHDREDLHALAITPFGIEANHAMEAFFGAVEDPITSEIRKIRGL